MHPFMNGDSLVITSAVFLTHLLQLYITRIKKFRQIVNIYIFSKSHLFKNNLVLFNTKKVSV